jgi:hypothetical protein
LNKTISKKGLLRFEKIFENQDNKESSAGSAKKGNRQLAEERKDTKENNDETQVGL